MSHDALTASAISFAVIIAITSNRSISQYIRASTIVWPDGRERTRLRLPVRLARIVRIVLTC